MIKSEIYNQSGRKEQRMRNILVVLAMFVCTSICLGWQQEIIIDGDIVNQNESLKLEQLQKQYTQRRQQLEHQLLPPLSHDHLQRVLEQMQKYLQQQPHMRNLLVQQLKQPQQSLEEMRDVLGEKRKMPLLLKLLRLLEHGQQEQKQQAERDLQQLWQHLEQQEPQEQLLQQQQQLLQQQQQLEEHSKQASVKYSDIAGNGNPNSDPDKYKHGKALEGDVWNNPNNNRLTINTGAKVGNAFGAKMNKASVVKNKDNKDFLSMTNNEVIVSGGEFGCGNTNGNIAGAWADDDIADLMNISSNTVIITGGSKIGNVYGGRTKYGTVSSSTVRIEGGTVGWNVYGGYIVNNGTATENKVNLSDVDVTRDVYGARIGTDKKAEFERAEEEMTEAFERVEAHVAKYAKADRTKLKRVLVDAIAGAKIAVTATKALKAFNSLAAAEADIEAIDAAFEEVLGPLALGGLAGRDEVETVKAVDENNKMIESIVLDRTERADAERDERDGRAEFEKDIKEKINKFKAEIAKFRGYVIAGIARAEATYVLASSNEVTITGGRVGRNIYGGYIVRNGTATLNKVNLTSVTATKDVYGAWIGNDGLASSNTVTIINGETVQNVYGGYIVKDGTATGNTVTISGGKIKGNVFGGYVGGNGQATYNTINITAAELSSKQSFPEFSTATILCGGICDNADKNDAFTGNTLNIETKGVVVKGISNFEKYKFNLKDIKPGDTVLTATGGGCSWDIRGYKHTSDCAVDLSKSSISSLRTQGVLNKKDRFTLIKSPHGFEGEVETKQCDFENEGLLIKYCWDIKIADNKEDLEAVLADKKIRDEGFARSLSEGYGAGVVCVNNGMDCIFSKMEETEELLGEGAKLGAKLPGKGEIGAFGGLAASKSKYDIDKGSHIDMIGTSMMGGVGVRVEVGGKELSSTEQSSEQSSPELSSKKPSSKELGSELTVGVFAEHGTGESDIHYENKNEGKSKYVGGGLLGRYNIYENELSGTKLYGEAILRAGQVENKFDSKKMKDSKGKEYKYKYADAMYGGCAVGGGYKHKVSEKIDLDWSLRYMFGRQWEKDVKREDADGNRMKFKNVTSNRIRIGVRGKYVELEKIKPYAGIGCEYELDGKVKGAIENGADMIDMPVSDFGGVTGIGELGVSGKVWKFGVDISGQGYLGVRKGFGGMLKLKYAFGKDAHGSLASSKASSLASSKAPGSKSPRS